MSLAEKWEEIEKREQFRWTPSLWDGVREAMQQAFYAGAEATYHFGTELIVETKPLKIDIYPVGQDDRYEILVNEMFVWDWTGLRQAEHCAHNLARAVPRSMVKIHAEKRRG